MVAIAIGTVACTPAPRVDMNAIAERYVRLVLLVGQHDSDYVDAYYGDPKLEPSGHARGKAIRVRRGVATPL